VTDPGVLTWPDLPDWLAAEPALLPDGDPAVPVLFVDLDAPGTSGQANSLLQAITPAPPTTVRTTSGLVPVSPPRARRPRSAAAFLGRDTREVLAGL
jgi:hypothetical protein